MVTMVTVQEETQAQVSNDTISCIAAA